MSSSSASKRSSQYTRIILNGIPYWKESAGTEGKLYYYESATQPADGNRICLGTEATGLYPDWQSRLEQVLSSYREAQEPRGRAPVSQANATTGGISRSDTGSCTENQG
jgi:hypothetical protein